MSSTLHNYDIDKELLEKLRSEKAKQNSQKLINEDEAKDDKPIAITNDPKFGNMVLEKQIEGFRQAVNGGARFSKPNEEDALSNPLVYFPNTGNVVFSGSIPPLSDLKFQFSLNDVTGSPYIFVNGLALTEEAITTINKIRGYYLNWRDEFLASEKMLSDIAKMEKE